jgi:hypothetical protein
MFDPFLWKRKLFVGLAHLKNDTYFLFGQTIAKIGNFLQTIQ